MKQYYNKATCNAAFILKLKKEENGIFVFLLDDGSDYIAINGPSSENFFVRTKLINSHALYLINKTEKNIDIPIGEWVIPSIPVYLVERYDMEKDCMRVGVVEEKTFRANFFIDEESKLIEMHSVEKPVHYRS